MEGVRCARGRGRFWGGWVEWTRAKEGVSISVHIRMDGCEGSSKPDRVTTFTNSRAFDFTFSFSFFVTPPIFSFAHHGCAVLYCTVLSEKGRKATQVPKPALTLRSPALPWPAQQASQPVSSPQKRESERQRTGRGRAAIFPSSLEPAGKIDRGIQYNHGHKRRSGSYPALTSIQKDSSADSEDDKSPRTYAWATRHSIRSAPPVWSVSQRNPSHFWSQALKPHFGFSTERF